jgi:Zn-dependent protease with chaperone function
MRSLIECHDLPVDGPELEGLPPEEALGAVEQPEQLVVPARDARERQPGALPDIVVVDFRHGGAEAALELRFHREEVLPFALERVVLGEIQLETQNADVSAGHTRAIVTFRFRLWMIPAVLVVAAWVVAAAYLYRTSVPGSLSLPHVDETSYWSAHDLDRAESFERFLTADYLLASVVGAVALFVLAVWAPGFARGTGLGPVGAGIIVGMVTIVVIWAVSIPFSLAEQWWFRRHGLSHESYLEWLIAPWSQLGALAVLTLFLIAVTMALARWIGRFWWIAGAPVFVSLAAFFAFVLPFLDYYDQRPVSTEPELAASLPEIESRTGAGPTDIRIAQVSDTTSLVNAYTEGLGPSERVVLWDTFLDGRFTTDEVRVVLAHELGHVAKSHILKSLAWYALFAFPLAFLVAELTRRRGGMGEPGNVPLAALILVILSFGLAPAENAITRRYEAEADWIALQATRDPDSARRLFVRFVGSDLEDPTPSFWETQLFGSHPSVAERVAMTRAWAERNR